MQRKRRDKPGKESLRPESRGKTGCKGGRRLPCSGNFQWPMGGVGEKVETRNGQRERETSVRERAAPRREKDGGGAEISSRLLMSGKPDAAAAERNLRRTYSSWRSRRVLPSFSRRAVGIEAMAASSVFWSWTSCRLFVKGRVCVDRRLIDDSYTFFRTFSLYPSLFISLLCLASHRRHCVIGPVSVCEG